MSVNIGRLVDVDPRAAWEREDANFTPWLAENLDRLSEAIGIPLELTGREHAVGRYAADIFAFNPEDGSTVLIENQLEWSDHRHLGQIMTYLAGLEAHTVVWLAPYFRDEHLSALRWLNQNTAEQFSFFAIKLRVVQIGDSPLAPLFDVVEKPNSWERSLAKTSRDAVDSEIGWRRAFWDRYLTTYPHASSDRGGGGQGSSRWRSVLGSDLIVARWIGDGAASVFIRGDRGVSTPKIYRRFRKNAQILEPILGTPLGDAEWYPFEITKDFDLADPVAASDAINWLEETTDRFVTAIAANPEKFA